MPFSTSENHSFDIELAAHLNSVDLAILVHHFQFWIYKNQEAGRNFRDGRTWTYQTRDEIAKHFPYWSSTKVRRYTDKLEKMGVLKKGNYNKLRVDKTIWYAFENEKMFMIGRFAKWIGRFASSIGRFAKPIPDPNPYSKTSDYIKDLGLANAQIQDLGLDPLAEKLLAANVGLMTQQISNKQQSSEISLGITDEIEAIKAEASEDILKILLDKIIDEVKNEPLQEEIVKTEPVKEKKSIKSSNNSTKHNFKNDNYQRRKQHNCYYVDKNDLTKRFKLTEEQIQSFNFLKTQNITDQKGQLVKDESLCFWAKTYKFDRLVDVCNEAFSYEAKTSRKAQIESILSRESTVPNAESNANRRFAEDFVKANGFHTLKIYKNYVSFELGRSKQEIPLNMNNFDFIRTLKDKYENSKAYS